jgi:biopolymer transport protein ExbD
MGVSVDTGGKGGKRPLNAELNLVPFIDLLVCCICFLLITAVWTQMARINVNQQAPSSAALTPPPDQVEKPKLKVSIEIGSDGYVITSGPDRLVIPKKGEEYDTEMLGQRLTELGKSDLEKDYLRVLVQDGIAYKDIVRTMDTAIANKFADIRLGDATAAM